MEMRGLIETTGGSSAFSRKTGIPLRTVENWKSGKCSPSKWLPEKLEFWLNHASKADRRYPDDERQKHGCASLAHNDSGQPERTE